VKGDLSSSASDAAAAAAAAPTPAAPAPAPTAAAAAPAPQSPQQPKRHTAIDWEAKRRKRTVEDIAAAARRAGITAPPPPNDTSGSTLDDALARGVEALEALIPGFQVDLERMKAIDWARAALDPNACAVRLVALKGAYPGADLARVLQEKPALLLKPPEQLVEDARQVHKLLEGAKDRDALVTALPMLTDPKVVISVLVTVEKWYFKKKDPIAVLEADPDLIRRAEVRFSVRCACVCACLLLLFPAAILDLVQHIHTHTLAHTPQIIKACDVPLEPVYIDAATGEYMAPSLNYKEKRAEWQAYIDRTVYKQKD
jgi:hypothetical protein